MIELYVTLQTLGVDLTRKARNRLNTREDERGAQIIEYLVIAVGVLAVAALVVVAVRTFVEHHTTALTGGN